MRGRVEGKCVVKERYSWRMMAFNCTNVGCLQQGKWTYQVTKGTRTSLADAATAARTACAR
eukprot:7858663-Alexandrium_andersonii.AAC.1